MAVSAARSLRNFPGTLVLLGAGKGLENGVNEGFPRVTNTVFVWSQGATQIPYQGMPINRQISLRPADVDAIARNVSSVGFIKAQNSVGIWGGSAPYVVRKSKNGGFSIQGGFAGVEDFNSLKITEGRSLNGLDERQRRKVALIGQRVREQLFTKDENPLGDDITINGITFQVIGVYKSLQNGNQQQEEQRIYLPNDTLRYSFNQIGTVGGAARAELLGRARALLHLINFEEPFGLAVIEAMACGTPVIAFNRGSMPELIDHGVTGFLVNTIEEAVVDLIKAFKDGRLPNSLDDPRYFNIKTMQKVNLQ